jgi:hypothetical protein
LLENKANKAGTGILDLADIYIQENQTDNPDYKFKKELILKKVQEGGKIDMDLAVYFWNDEQELELLMEKVIKDDLIKDPKNDTDSSMRELWQTVCRRKDGFLNPSLLQILSPCRSGNWGVDYLNTYFQKMFNGSELEKYNLDGITLGDKVMQIRNRSGNDKIAAYNFEKGTPTKETIYNGEIGFSFKHPFDKNQKVMRRLERFSVIFESRSGSLRYNYGQSNGSFNEPVEENLELAYTLSIHKAQGSEFERIYLILPSNDRRLLSMELLYTGITRASKHLTIFAQNDISCFTKLSTIEKSNAKRINSSIFVFNPVPDEVVFPTAGNWYSENKKISTLSQYYVRSKSEMNIANILSLKQIPFEYETPLFASNGTMYLPDFTIKHKGKTYYWEHIGRLDLPDYEKHWNEKKSWYDKFFHNQLITTFEGDNQSKDIEKIIDDFFL